MNEKTAFLAPAYFQQTDTCFLAKDLLGKGLYAHVGKGLSGGIIVETEAYCGTEDKACHAYLHKKKNSAKDMYLSGGRAYCLVLK